MPLYKGKGTRTLAVNYRPISLIHPGGRWYATCLNHCLECTTPHLRAVCQSGFRVGYRMEDNAAVLQTIFEWGTVAKSLVFAVVVDLVKAYDSIIHSKLFEALVAELTVPADLV